MFEQAKRLIAVDGIINVRVENTFISIKKVDQQEQQEISEISFQMEFNYSEERGCYSPVFSELNTADAWRNWRKQDSAYRSIFVKVLYGGKIPQVPSLKHLTASGLLALGQLEVNKEDFRMAACYKCGLHPDFVIFAKGRKAEPIEGPLPTINILL
jgi:hypothetical protein